MSGVISSQSLLTSSGWGALGPVCWLALRLGSGIALSPKKQRIKRPKQNWAVRRPIVTKRSTANANTEKSIRQQCRSGISTSPTPCCGKSATTTPKQFQTTWRFGKDWQHADRARDLQQPCSRESCHSVTLAKVLLIVAAATFFAKKVTAAISFSGRKHIGFLDSKRWSSPVRASRRPKHIWVRGFRSLIWSARTFAATFSCLPRRRSLRPRSLSNEQCC